MEPAPRNRHAINFDWLIRLRWFAAFGQGALVGIAHAIGLAVPAAPLVAILVVVALTNAGCVIAARRARAVREWWLAAVMGFDTVALTALLSLTGGPFNPFSFLYLVQIALAAIVLRETYTWALVLLSMAGSALLFAHHRPLSVGGGTHEDHMRFHLRGMWVAFTVAAASIVYFLMRVTRALAGREADLARARELTARQERLASLATLAAGAAHELSTPLATIAVVARELERSLPAGVAPPAALDDVQLIRTQVARCRAILDRMAADAGQTTGEGARELPVAELIDEAVGGAAESPAVLVHLDEGAARLHLRVPPRAVAGAIRGLVKNAQQAGGEVTLHAAAEAGRLRVEIRDRGCGMSPDVLARAGEPFFTTKPPGQGMGLGLFLARAVAQRLGGELLLASRPGAGTTATLLLPLEGGANNVRMGN